jgi:hypothetical protein
VAAAPVAPPLRACGAEIGRPVFFWGRTLREGAAKSTFPLARQAELVAGRWPIAAMYAGLAHLIANIGLASVC